MILDTFKHLEREKKLAWDHAGGERPRRPAIKITNFGRRRLAHLLLSRKGTKETKKKDAASEVPTEQLYINA